MILTNIIESFGRINPVGFCNLEERWIEGVDSFAVYFPSLSKESQASKKGYQYTDQRGKKFVSDIESKENIQASREKMLLKCKNFFKKEFKEIGECEEFIYEVLYKIDDIRKKLLNISNELETLYIGDRTIHKFADDLKQEIDDLRKDINLKKLRIKAWRQHFKHLPLWYKILKFMKYVKRKIEIKNRIFIEPYENFISEYMSLDEIEEKYSFVLKEIKIKLDNIEKNYNKVIVIKENYDDCIGVLKNLKIDILKDVEENHNKLEKMNLLIDKTLRYIEFWLAIHYYECRWVKGEDELTDKQKGKTFKNVLEQFYNRLSMVTPCYVMTFYQLPKNFRYYIENNKYSYLYNLIDLLIVDEAGQVQYGI